MGRGNVNVHGEYEGLYYVDRDYLDCFISKYADDNGENEFKMLGEMDAADFNDFDYDYDLSDMNYDNFIAMFVEGMEKGLIALSLLATTSVSSWKTHCLRLRLLTMNGAMQLSLSKRKMITTIV